MWGSFSPVVSLSPHLYGAVSHAWQHECCPLATGLGDPDVGAVVIAAPVCTHLELASAALQAGKHVLKANPQSEIRIFLLHFGVVDW